MPSLMKWMQKQDNEKQHSVQIMKESETISEVNLMHGKTMLMQSGMNLPQILNKHGMDSRPSGTIGLIPNRRRMNRRINDFYKN